MMRMQGLPLSLLSGLILATCLSSLALAWHSGHETQDKAAHAEWKRLPAPQVPTIVGEGQHRYEWNAHWMQLPEGRDWLGSTHGCIALDQMGRLYMSAETGPAIRVYGIDGKQIDSFGEDWGGGVHGLSIVTHNPDDSDAAQKSPILANRQTQAGEEPHPQTLWIAHTAKGQVMQTSLSGEILRTIGWPEESGKYASKKEYKPTSIALGPDGTLFIADGYGKSWIHRYSPAGEYLDSFGGPGDQPKNLRTPHGLWMDWKTTPPTLLVADRENHRLARFDLSGKFLAGTDPESGLLRRPCHVQFHGDLGVVSDLAGRITLLDSDLKLVAHLGDNADKAQRANYGVLPQDWREGSFCAPHCAGFDPLGNLYVMDWNVAGRITRLTPLGDGAAASTPLEAQETEKPKEK